MVVRSLERENVLITVATFFKYHNHTSHTASYSPGEQQLFGINEHTFVKQSLLFQLLRPARTPGRETIPKQQWLLWVDYLFIHNE